MKVLSRGVRIKYEEDVYTIEKVIGIDDFWVIYSVSGEDGGGPRRIIVTPHDMGNISFENDDDKDTAIEAEKLYHYALDWDSGVVKERFAYGLVIPPNKWCHENRYIIFSPYYFTTLPENKLGVVSTDYQLITKKQSLDEAYTDIIKAVIDKGVYYENKLDSYKDALIRIGLDNVESVLSN